jgi:hypothetical protein
LWYQDYSCCQGKVNGAVGRRTDALFFARHLDSFIVTSNLSSTYRDLVLFHNFTVTLSLAAIYQDWQKTRHRDTDAN